MKYAEEYKKIQANIARLNKFTEETMAAQKKTRVKAELDALVTAGKVLPAERDAGLDDLLYATDATTLHKFSEKGADGKPVTVEQTPFDKYLAALNARPCLVRFGERVKSSPPASKADDEKAKVQRFAEEDRAFNHCLKAAGRTPADYVRMFEDALKKKPELTAAQFGVPEAYAAN